MLVLLSCLLDMLSSAEALNFISNPEHCLSRDARFFCKAFPCFHFRFCLRAWYLSREQLRSPGLRVKLVAVTNGATGKLNPENCECLSSDEWKNGAYFPSTLWGLQVTVASPRPAEWS